MYSTKRRGRNRSIKRFSRNGQNTNSSNSPLCTKNKTDIDFCKEDTKVALCPKATNRPLKRSQTGVNSTCKKKCQCDGKEQEYHKTEICTDETCIAQSSNRKLSKHLPYTQLCPYVCKQKDCDYSKKDEYNKLVSMVNPKIVEIEFITNRNLLTGTRYPFDGSEPWNMDNISRMLESSDFNTFRCSSESVLSPVDRISSCKLEKISDGEYSYHTSKTDKMGLSSLIERQLLPSKLSNTYTSTLLSTLGDQVENPNRNLVCPVIGDRICPFLKVDVCPARKRISNARLLEICTGAGAQTKYSNDDVLEYSPKTTTNSLFTQEEMPNSPTKSRTCPISKDINCTNIEEEICTDTETEIRSVNTKRKSSFLQRSVEYSAIKHVKCPFLKGKICHQQESLYPVSEDPKSPTVEGKKKCPAKVKHQLSCWNADSYNLADSKTVCPGNSSLQRPHNKDAFLPNSSCTLENDLCPNKKYVSKEYRKCPALEGETCPLSKETGDKICPGLKIKKCPAAEGGLCPGKLKKSHLHTNTSEDFQRKKISPRLDSSKDVKKIQSSKYSLYSPSRFKTCSHISTTRGKTQKISVGKLEEKIVCPAKRGGKCPSNYPKCQVNNEEIYPRHRKRNTICTQPTGVCPASLGLDFPADKGKTYPVMQSSAVCPASLGWDCPANEGKICPAMQKKKSKDMNVYEETGSEHLSAKIKERLRQTSKLLTDEEEIYSSKWRPLGTDGEIRNKLSRIEGEESYPRDKEHYEMLDKDKKDLKVLGDKIDSKTLTDKMDSKELADRNDSKALADKMDSKELGAKKDSKVLDGKKDSRVLGGKKDSRVLGGKKDSKVLGGKRDSKLIGSGERIKSSTGSGELKSPILTSGKDGILSPSQVATGEDSVAKGGESSGTERGRSSYNKDAANRESTDVAGSKQRGTESKIYGDKMKKASTISGRQKMLSTSRVSRTGGSSIKPSVSLESDRRAEKVAAANKLSESRKPSTNARKKSSSARKSKVGEDSQQTKVLPDSEAKQHASAQKGSVTTAGDKGSTKRSSMRTSELDYKAHEASSSRTKDALQQGVKGNVSKGGGQHSDAKSGQGPPTGENARLHKVGMSSSVPQQAGRRKDMKTQMAFGKKQMGGATSKTGSRKPVPNNQASRKLSSVSETTQHRKTSNARDQQRGKGGGSASGGYGGSPGVTGYQPKLSENAPLLGEENLRDRSSFLECRCHPKRRKSHPVLERRGIDVCLCTRGRSHSYYALGTSSFDQCEVCSHLRRNFNNAISQSNIPENFQRTRRRTLCFCNINGLNFKGKYEGCEACSCWKCLIAEKKRYVSADNIRTHPYTTHGKSPTYFEFGKKSFSVLDDESSVHECKYNTLRNWNKTYRVPKEIRSYLAVQRETSSIDRNVKSQLHVRYGVSKCPTARSEVSLCSNFQISEQDRMGSHRRWVSECRKVHGDRYPANVYLKSHISEQDGLCRARRGSHDRPTFKVAICESNRSIKRQNSELDGLHSRLVVTQCYPILRGRENFKYSDFCPTLQMRNKMYGHIHHLNSFDNERRSYSANRVHTLHNIPYFMHGNGIICPCIGPPLVKESCSSESRQNSSYQSFIYRPPRPQRKIVSDEQCKTHRCSPAWICPVLRNYGHPITFDSQKCFSEDVCRSTARMKNIPQYNNQTILPDYCRQYQIDPQVVGYKIHPTICKMYSEPALLTQNCMYGF